MNHNHTNDLSVMLLRPGAQAPVYSSAGAGAFDIKACFPEDHLKAMVRHNHPVVVPTGLSFEVPPDWTLFIFSRSGHGFNHDVRLANSVGVIDSDYRGEVMVKLTADKSENTLIIKHGDKIAQGILMYTPRQTLKVVDKLSSTERGEGGFGSTGA